MLALESNDRNDLGDSIDEARPVQPTGGSRPHYAAAGIG